MNEILPVLLETTNKLKETNKSLGDELSELVKELKKRIENNEIEEIINAETKIQEFLTDHKTDIEEESNIESIQTELSSLKTSIETKAQEGHTEKKEEKKWWWDLMSDGWKRFWKWTWIAALATVAYVAAVKWWWKNTTITEWWDDEESGEDNDLDQKEIASWYIDPLRGKGSKIPNNGFFWAPRDGWWRRHKWLDISAPEWTIIYAAMAWEVEKIWRSQKWWNSITITHPNWEKTKYLHLKEKPRLEKWDRVDTESIIGIVGNTGVSTWPHLHFEVIKNGKAINPWGCCDFAYVEEGNSKWKVA
jgi:murein DD-endopeptidase MepM/ murein hydrolase activator NlpD